MNNRNNKMELLGNAPIPKALMAMGIPTMLGMMVNAIYNLVDAYFVGGLGTSQMGGNLSSLSTWSSSSGIRLTVWKWFSFLSV